MNHPPSDTTASCWLRERECFLLLALVVACYFVRVGDVSIRGEESRWAQVAREMLWSGSGIVPHQQGQPFLSRPPLQSWLIAGVALLRGQLDVIAVRLPAVCATLLITLLVYGYSRQFMGRLGALAAGCALATMAEMLHMGRHAETEACFVLFVSGSLLIWHWGYARGWPAWQTWLAGYSLAALGGLTKGTQAPVYFAGAIGVYLLLRRDWRMLFSFGHVLGVLTFALIVGAWQVPFYQEQGWPGTRTIWLGDAAMRYRHQRHWTDLALQLVVYPLQVLGCTKPWSLLLLAYCDRTLRRSLREAWPAVSFLTVCLLVTFPTCWLTPGAMTRYYLPLYPCLAPLIGLVVQRWAEGDLSPRLVLNLQRSLLLLAVVMLIAAVGVVSGAWLPVASLRQTLEQPAGLAWSYGLLTVVLAGILLWHRRSGGEPSIRLAVLSVACFLGLTYCVPILNATINRSETAAAAVAELKGQLPADVRLVSFDPIHHVFAYHYGAPIALQAWPTRPDTWPERGAYFCFDVYNLPQVPRRTLPFTWEEVGAIAVDRNKHTPPEQVVIVGRRY